MTDKVQKIREEVARLQKRAKHNFDTSLTENERQFWLGESNVLTLIGKHIDSLQEEPKFKTGDHIRPIDSSLGVPRTIVDICDGWYVTDKGTLDFEFEDNWEAVEEPVSEDLEEAITTKFNELVGGHGEFDKVYIEGVAKAVAIECGFVGAKWQKEQFEKNRLAACDRQTGEEAEIEQSFVMGIIEKEHRQPTFDDAIKYGMRLQKEQMTAKAIDAHCFGFQGAALFSFRLPADNYLVGSEVKVIVIKEE